MHPRVIQNLLIQKKFVLCKRQEVVSIKRFPNNIRLSGTFVNLFFIKTGTNNDQHENFRLVVSPIISQRLTHATYLAHIHNFSVLYV